MEVRKTVRGYLIKLSRGEKVVESLTEFCSKEGMGSGLFHAIGAVKNAEIGYYDMKKREYFFEAFPEDMEVASMTGNVARRDGQTALHVHAVLSQTGKSLACVGAHLKEAEVAVTLEVFLEPWGEPIERVYDHETGLALLQP